MLGGTIYDINFVGVHYTSVCVGGSVCELLCACRHCTPPSSPSHSPCSPPLLLPPSLDVSQVRLPADVSDEIDEDPTGNKAVWDRGLMSGATQKVSSLRWDSNPHHCRVYWGGMGKFAPCVWPPSLAPLELNPDRNPALLSG